MMFSRIYSAVGTFLAIVTAWSMSLAAHAQITQDSIELLQPFGSSQVAKVCPDAIGTWLGYWRPAVEWAFDVGLGLSTLWMVWGAILVATSGLNGNDRAKGFGVMKAALGSLLLFVFAGSVLAFLNNIYFTAGDSGGCA